VRIGHRGVYLARVKNRFTDFAYVYFLVGLMVPYVIVYVPMVTLYKGSA
jgi:raffinose/stachyose/melibiose transport system permease protein